MGKKIFKLINLNLSHKNRKMTKNIWNAYWKSKTKKCSLIDRMNNYPKPNKISKLKKIDFLNQFQKDFTRGSFRQVQNKYIWIIENQGI